MGFPRAQATNTIYDFTWPDSDIGECGMLGGVFTPEKWSALTDSEEKFDPFKGTCSAPPAPGGNPPGPITGEITIPLPIATPPPMADNKLLFVISFILYFASIWLS